MSCQHLFEPIFISIHININIYLHILSMIIATNFHIEVNLETEKIKSNLGAPIFFLDVCYPLRRPHKCQQNYTDLVLPILQLFSVKKCLRSIGYAKGIQIMCYIQHETAKISTFEYIFNILFILFAFLLIFHYFSYFIK